MTIKILITERQYNLITEASKVDVLINKLKIKPEIAEEINTIAGPLSIWLVKKLLYSEAEQPFEYMMSAIPEDEEKKARELFRKDKKYRESWGLQSINRRGIASYRPTLTSIMDWIRVGLNGNVKPYQDLELYELFNKSREWHHTLQIGANSMNYIEKNEIIRDYRDENGMGFYWVNLNTNDSSEECERMGHCGRTSSSNTILSLREYSKMNDMYTLNKSCVTCAVGKSDGIIYQSKGPRNSKPNEKYTPYLIDLILNSTNPEIMGFKSEYAAENDFSLLDVSEETFKEIYEKKPHIFNQRKLKRRLKQIGVDIKGTKLDEDLILYIEIAPSDVRYYLDDDFRVGSYRTKDGRQIEKYFSEVVLTGDFYDYDLTYYPSNDEMINEIDNVNKKKIIKILSKIAENRGLKSQFDIDINNMTLEELINDYDKDEQIIDALRISFSDAYNSVYQDSALKSIKNALSQYGTVTKFGHEGVELEINLNNVIEKSNISEEMVDEYFENCSDELFCVFNEILGEYYDKPYMRLDTLDIYPDNKVYNTYLGDRLYDYDV